MVYTLTLDSTRWLAALTGKASLTINGNLLQSPAPRLPWMFPLAFPGFLFKVNGALVLVADVLAKGRRKCHWPHLIKDLN